MKHLVPYLQDDQKAADYLRQLCWPDGVTCPRCGSDAVEPCEQCNNGLQRLNCVHCAARWGQQFAMFTDWTSAIFEESKLRPLEWLLVIGLWQLKLNATEIAAAADMIHTALRKSGLWRNTSHTLCAVLTKTVENSQAFVPKSHVGLCSEG